MREYLAQALEAEEKIRSRMEQIGRLKALAARGMRTLPDDEGGRGILETLQDMEKELHRQMQDWRGVKQEVANVIEGVNKDSYRKVLTYRYLCGWDWVRIANRMNYSMDRVWHLHSDAVRALRRQRGFK